MRSNFLKWIPSLGNRTICIEQANRLYIDDAAKKDANHPHTLIFKLLDYTDHQAILRGARALPVKVLL